MRYITTEDIATLIHNQMAMQSVENDGALLDSIEDLVISEVCAYLAGRYDTDRIFGERPVRTGLLVRIFYEYEGWAVDMLERLRDDKMRLPADVPVVKNEDGSDASAIMYGHSRNSGWHI